MSSSSSSLEICLENLQPGASVAVLPQHHHISPPYSDYKSLTEKGFLQCEFCKTSWSFLFPSILCRTACKSSDWCWISSCFLAFRSFISFCLSHSRETWQVYQVSWIHPSIFGFLTLQLLALSQVSSAFPLALPSSFPCPLGSSLKSSLLLWLLLCIYPSQLSSKQ